MLPAERDAGPVELFSESTRDHPCTPVSPVPEQAVEGWRAAAERAAAAEQVLKQALDDYLNGKAAAPTPVQIAEAKLLRSLANKKLQATLSVLTESVIKSSSTG